MSEAALALSKAAAKMAHKTAQKQDRAIKKQLNEKMKKEKQAHEDVLQSIKIAQTQAKQPVIKFQAIDEKSFFVHKTPSILGAEDAQTWKIKKAKIQESENDLITFGYSFMTHFNLKKFESKALQKGQKSSDNPETPATKLTSDQ